MIDAVVIRTDSKHDAMVKHLGYSSVDDAPAGTMRDIDLLQESQFRLSQVKVIPEVELSPKVRSNLELVRAIARDISPDIKVLPAEIPAASNRVRTVGLYSKTRREIYSPPEQILMAKMIIFTTVHELSHHISGAIDGAPEHEREMDSIGNKVAARIAHGDYDKYLKDVTW